MSGLFRLKYSAFWIGALIVRLVAFVLRSIYKGHQPHPHIHQHAACQSSLELTPWYFYSPQEEQWLSFNQGSEGPKAVESLRVATYNVLTNEFAFLDEITKSRSRFNFICEDLLPSLEADIICLNEVNVDFLPILLRQNWLRSRYLSSAKDARYCRPRANVILCKKDIASRLFVEIYSENIPGTRPAFVAETFLATENSIDNPAPALIASAHLTANYNYRRVREYEVKRLAQALRQVKDEIPSETAASSFIVGDLNFHSELENRSIPSGYLDLWLFVRHSEEGFTYDPTTNPIIARKLSPERTPMRLDRVLADINIERLRPGMMQLFGATPIPGEAARGIFPSDHYGILFEIHAN